MASFQQLQKDAELAASNNRIVAIAAALQGKFAIVKQYDDSLALIQIHSADSLFTPGHKRMTPFDVNVTATVFSPLSSGSSLYTVADSWKSFVAYDLVAIFSSPFPAGQQLQSFNVPANWLNALDTLAARPSETIRSIFADEHVINGLLRSAGFAVATTQRAHCAGRRESYGAIGPLSMVPRLSIGH